VKPYQGSPLPTAIPESNPHCCEFLHIDVKGRHGDIPQTLAQLLLACVEAPACVGRGYKQIYHGRRSAPRYIRT